MKKQGEKARISIINAIASLFRVSQLYISDNVKEFNIGKGQWFILNRLLFGSDGLNHKELADDLHIDKANITRAISKLESEGYVYSEVSWRDARYKNIYVTEKAQGIEPEYHQVYKNLNNIFMKDFTKEEKTIARELMYRMLDNITEYMDDEQIIE
jgi:DNA-binding MarR family transcriptional regulator